MRSSCAALLLISLCLGPTTPAHAQGHSGAERKLEAALACYSKLHFDCFGARLREALTLARRQHATPMLVGRIHLCIGVHHAVLHRRSAARRSFRKALRRDPLLDLDPQQFKPELVTLFRKVRAKLKGSLAVNVDAKGMVVHVDGEQIGVAPLRVKLSIGRYMVRVTGPGAMHKEKVLIRVDKTTHVEMKVGPREAERSTTAPRRGRFWTWIAAGGAAVTLAVAIGLGASAEADYTAWEAQLERGKAGDGDRQTWEALGQDVEAKATAANVLFVTSGVLAVTTAVLFFIEGHTTERPAAARTTLGPGPGAMPGLSLTRSF